MDWTLKQKILAAVAVLLLIILMILAWQNRQPTQWKFLFWEFTLAKILAILLAFIAGIIVTLTVQAYRSWKIF